MRVRTSAPGCSAWRYASFTRARTLDGVKGSGFYLWGPETLRAFGDSENFGVVEY